ncbi:MAG: EAL domain-containing protein [Mesorhizobium sp.]|nr:EAL domain-containing protein [Mesorhizobium sp.]MCO5162957.1 EAL domain-containing protein [Mesorhizobium sp.]
MLRRAFASAYVPAGLALIVVVCAGVYAGYLNRTLHAQSMRAEVQTKIDLIRAKLEGHVNSNIQLVRGLVAAIETEPEMSQARFAALAEILFREETQLRNIAGAPDLVVSLMYPMAGNGKAIGLDYRAVPDQRNAALRARDTRQLVVAGPVALRQGGVGIIARFPIFIRNGDGTDRFWGILSAVIDVDKLYRDSGLFDGDLGLEITLSGKDATGTTGERFMGGRDLADQFPVTAEVVLPSGSWQIAAIPKGGWVYTPGNALFIRGILVLAMLVVVVPIFYAGRLYGERAESFGTLAQRERELADLSQRLALALDASKIGVWEHNTETNELVWDDRVNELYGLPQDGKPRGYSDWVGAIHPDDLDRALRDFQVAAESHGDYASEFRLLLPDGTLRHVRSKAKFMQGSGEEARLIGAEWDVTEDVRLREDLERARFLAEMRNAELEAAKARIEHNSLHDPLTGLPNRRYLDQVLDNVAASGGGEETALLHIDLDRFKQINDTLGHAAGDAMLVHAANVLKSNVGGADFVARIGGDEFVILCLTPGGSERLSSLAENIIGEMRKPVSYHGHQCRFGVSIGIAVERGRDADPKRLLVNADIALYRAKSRGRNRHEFFTEALQAEIVGTKRMADEILNGLERNEFVAYYQPQVDGSTFEIAGVEALVRWNHPRRGMLPPGYFLKSAEELNVVANIDRIILEQALTDFRRWEAKGLHVPRISVNVSARRLQDGELIASLRDLDIPRNRLSFELVESIFLDDNDDLMIWNVNQVKELGIEVEIDDFGTGYASIVSLQKLKPRRLKIDRQLIMPIVASVKQRRLIESITEIGKSLDIEIVAEGVETMQHAEILRKIGCDFLQGYAFAKPMSATDVERFVEAHRPRKAS